MNRIEWYVSKRFKTRIAVFIVCKRQLGINNDCHKISPGLSTPSR